MNTTLSTADVAGLTPDVLSDLIARVVDVAHPLRIVLFGSAARGEATQSSDLDLLIVVPEGAPARRLAQRIHVGLIGFSVPVDIIAVTESDLARYADTPGLIYQPALRDGRVIYAAQPA
jgi:predicted nucleotidyltransferase